LANLFLLPAWVELLPGSVGAYFFGYSVGWMALLSLSLHGSIWFALLLSYWTWLQRRAPEGLLAKLSVCTFSLLAVNALRVALVDQSIYLNLEEMVIHFGWPRFLLIYSPPILAIWAWFIVDFTRAMKIGALALTLLAPLPFVLLYRTAAPILQSSPPPALEIAAPRRPLRAPAIFLIFDEMDQSRAFDFRPKYYSLPNLDRLASEGVFCDEAYPPNSETYRSIPSLLSGKVASEARTSSDRELLLSFRETPSLWAPWSRVRDLPVVFGQACRTSLFINHYHAFSPAYLAARPMLTLLRTPYYFGWVEASHRYDGFRSSFLRQARCQAGAIPWLAQFAHRDIKDKSVPILYQRTLAECLQSIRSNKFDLIIVHWPIPHAPAIVDPKTGQIHDTPQPGQSNLDNILLVDQVIGQVRTTLEAQGKWDASLILVTSDHWQRKAADPSLVPTPEIPGLLQSRRRVPCIIKFPYQSEGIRRRQPINNIELFDLMEAFAQERSLDPLTFANKKPRTQPLGNYRIGVD
jgi:hypothetical protein